LTIQDVDKDYISAHQNVPFAFIQSKTDVVQQSFYVAIAGSMNLPASITPAEFYSDTNVIFEVSLLSSSFGLFPSHSVGDRDTMPILTS
jgi:hypothetical protein